MKVKVKVPTEIELKVGDEVIIDFEYERWKKRVRITRLVENHFGQYAVFSNHTWRPMETYGVTWIKAV